MVLQANFEQALWSEGPWSKHLQTCSIIVGLHPDQATDAIVDCALQLGKPFAAVPCCVFPRWGFKAVSEGLLRVRHNSHETFAHKPVVRC